MPRKNRTGIYFSRNFRKIKTNADARDFYFGGLASHFGSPRLAREFATKGFRIFRKPKLITFGISRKGVSQLGKFYTPEEAEILIIAITLVLNDPDRLKELIVQAYQETIGQAIDWPGELPSRYRALGEREEVVANDETITTTGRSFINFDNNPLRSLSRFSKKIKKRLETPDVTVTATGAGFSVEISAASFNELTDSSDLLIPSRNSPFRSAFMIIEFGTGIEADRVRPFQSIGATPYKIPPSLGGIPGEWIPFPIPAERMRNALKNINRVRGAQGRREALEQTNRRGYLKLRRGGRAGIHALFTKSGKPRDFAGARRKFIEVLGELLDNEIGEIAGIGLIPKIFSSRARADIRIQLNINLTG
jgi:hypothetical protein